MRAETSMTQSSRSARIIASPNPRFFVKAKFEAPSHYARMVKATTTEAANHLRAWREHREMSQEKLAELVGTAGNVISLLESGQRALSDKWINRLAPALGTKPGHLRNFDPENASDDILEIWADIPDERKPGARQILESLRAVK